MMDIAEAIKFFITHCLYEKNLGSNTITAYKIDLKQFSEFLKKNEYSTILVEIDKVILREYLEHLNTYKPKTIKRKIACLKAMFSFLEFEDAIAINPFRKMRIRIKEPKNLPISMSNDEVKQIILKAYSGLKKAKQKEGYLLKEATRDIAILELLFATGIRVSELCSLDKKDINLSTGLIKVVGKGNKERVIQICNSEALQSLIHYEQLFQRELKKKNFYFINRFGNRISSQSVRLMVKKYAKRAKLKKNITPHTFRHTFATLLLDEDVDIRYIQHMLGHSSILVTQLYTHVSNKKQEALLTAHHPRKKFSSMI